MEKVIDELYAVWEEMDNGLSGMVDGNSDEFYEKPVKFGFGDRIAEVYVCPETFEILEIALKQTMAFLIEEEGLERDERYEAMYEEYRNL